MPSLTGLGVSSFDYPATYVAGYELTSLRDSGRFWWHFSSALMCRATSWRPAGLLSRSDYDVVHGFHPERPPDPCHTGFRVFLWFMRTFRPRYLVHGHVHLYDRNAAREARYASTTVVNAYDHVVIDLEAAP